MRAAASSIASGNPSRRRQIRATTSGGLRGQLEVRAHVARPLGEQADRVRAKRVAASTFRQRQGGNRDTRLAGQPQRLAAGGQDANARASRQHARDEAGDVGENVLAVVDDEKQLGVAQALEDTGGGVRLRPGLGRVDGVGDDAADVRGVTRAGELDEPGAVGEVGLDRARQLERETALAGPGRSYERHETALAHAVGPPRRARLLGPRTT